MNLQDYSRIQNIQFKDATVTHLQLHSSSSPPLNLLPNLDGVHEHQPDVGYFELLKTNEVLERTIAQDPTETRMRIYQKTIDIRCLETTHIENYPEAIPPFISFRGHIDRLLKKYRPSMPHLIEDIILTPVYAISTRSQRFHIPTESNRILVFGTMDMLKLLGAATTIYMDGIFYIVPRLYCQLYTIHVMYENVMIPVIYALLPDKSRETYIQLFHIVINFCTLKGINFNPPNGQTDFEAAAISALRFVFPNIVIKGCFFHYSQALWRKCQALGLVRDYLIDSHVHIVVRRMTTLPFCKENLAEVLLSCYSMATNNPSLLRFIEYMDHTWLGETALFPHTIWTRYHVDGPRTNNHLEGFHHALKRKTSSAHPNVYVLKKILIENQNSNDIKLLQIHNGSIVRRANLTYERLNHKIDNLTSMYDRVILNLFSFLDNISFLVNFQSNNIYSSYSD
ncbi:unnamed protein product [Gordionus sp. m RMFG-2023]